MLAGLQYGAVPRQDMCGDSDTLPVSALGCFGKMRWWWWCMAHSATYVVMSPSHLPCTRKASCKPTLKPIRPPPPLPATRLMYKHACINTALLHRPLSMYIITPQGMNYVAGSLLLLLGPGLASQQQQQQQDFSSHGRRSRQHSSTTNSNGGGSNSSSAPQPVTPHTCNGHSDADNPSTGAPAAAAGGSGGGSFSRRATGCSASSGVAAAVSNLQQLEATVFECLLGFAERVLPGYYSPAMVAPQVSQGEHGALSGGDVGMTAMCARSTPALSSL